jgi:polysaccharide export outer membrane protein
VKDFEYKIQSNDIVSVRYQSITEKDFNVLSQQVQQQGGQVGVGGANQALQGELVDNQGMIPMPVVGKVKVAGLSIFEAQDTLQKLADIYLESSIVKVRLMNYHATVLGSVNGEAHLVFNSNRVSLMEAIGQAGGLDELADRHNIKVIRQIGNSVKVFYVDVLKEDFITSPFYYVHQNDVIIVPPLRQRPFKKYFATNISLVLSTLSLALLLITLNKK